ncbi:MAG: PQQ-like beta-propeller repeat protein [Verrucomicrobiales bacterium]|nr:PQQ-like beta-propeller repeat protein [Verrucomicrobiales bacterium]
MTIRIPVFLLACSLFSPYVSADDWPRWLGSDQSADWKEAGVIEAIPDSGGIYALGAEGNLTCLDVATGKLIWSKNLPEEYNTEAPIWGYSSHPLVIGDTLYCVGGGEGSVAVAFDKNTGAEKWRALSAVEPGYAPPTLINHAGVDQLLYWHSQALSALNPESGEVFWSLPLKPAFGMAIMSPRKSGDYLFASGHGRIGALMELDSDKPGAKFVWKAKPKEGVFASNCTPYIKDDYIYGADIDKSVLICARLSDGKRIWQDARPIFGTETVPGGGRHGTVFLTRNVTNGLFYLFNEIGELVIADLTPEGYTEKGRHALIEPTNEAFGRSVVWAAPAFAGKSIVVRNDKEMARYDLSR